MAGSLLVLTTAIALIAGGRVVDLTVLVTLTAIMAAGLQFLVAYCRLLDLGFAGFVGIGAYATAILMGRFGWSFWSGLIVSILLAAVVGILTGLPTARLRGDYFAIVSFGFAEIVTVTIRNWGGLTGGSFGLGGIPNATFWGMEIRRYPASSYLALAASIAVILFAACMYLRKTVLGAAMFAVGDDEVLAQLRGIDVAAVRLAAFACSAGIGGLSGALWSIYYKFLAPGDFSLLLSVQVLIVVVFADRLPIWGVIVAAAGVAPLNEALRRLLQGTNVSDAVRIMIYGLLLITLTRLRRAPGSGVLH
jgi:branched-chain amino acid transport system permease protein